MVARCSSIEENGDVGGDPGSNTGGGRREAGSRWLARMSIGDGLAIGPHAVGNWSFGYHLPIACRGSGSGPKLEPGLRSRKRGNGVGLKKKFTFPLPTFVQFVFFNHKTGQITFLNFLNHSFYLQERF